MKVVLGSQGDRLFDGYLAVPASPGPGLLILSEMFGLNSVMRDVADGYALQGYCVLVPNVFWRSQPSGALDYEGPDREAAWQRLKEYDYDAAAEDMATATEWLRACSTGTGEVGALGFCMGGLLAFLAASRCRVDAAMAFYALGISRHLGEVCCIKCPTQLHYGMQDKHVPVEEVEAVGRAVAGHPTITMHRYPNAGHSFLNTMRPGFNAAAAALARGRINTLLARMRGHGD